MLIYESLKKDCIYIDEKNQEKDQQHIETESNTKESEKDKVNLNKRLLDTETVISVKKIKKSNKKNSKKKNKVNSNTRLLDAEAYDPVIKKKKV